MKNNKKVFAIAMAMLTTTSAFPLTAVHAMETSKMGTTTNKEIVESRVAVPQIVAASSSSDNPFSEIRTESDAKKKIKKAKDSKELRDVKNNLSRDLLDSKEIKDAIKDREDDFDKDDKDDKDKGERDSKFKNGAKLKPEDLDLSNSGREVTGKVKKHYNASVSVYYNGRKIGSDTTNKNGKFTIRLDKKVDSEDDLKFYAGSGSNYDKVSKNIDGKEVKAKNLEVKNEKRIIAEFKDYKNTEIKVYYDGKYLGSEKTDKDGNFEFQSKDRIKNEDEIEFYVENESKTEVDSKDIIVTAAMPKTNVVMGIATAESKVQVKSAVADIKLGETKADKDGKFTITLNRDLISGERLVVISLVDDKEDKKTEYLVPQDFNDAKEEKVEAKNSSAYIKGYEDGSFKPNGKVTRAEASVMIARLQNGSDDFKNNGETKFADANNEWFSKEVAFVSEKGLINGYEDGSFKPNANITRAEFAKIIAVSAKNDAINKSPFKDINGHWAEAYIDNVFTTGFIKGYEDNTFKPDNEITRAEAVTILNATFNVKENADAKNKFSDVNSDDWFYDGILKAAK